MMKKYTGGIIILVSILVFGQSILAQKDDRAESVSIKAELKQINDSIKKYFPETYRYKGIWKYFDVNAKKEVETKMTYEGRLVNYKGCDISFSSAMKVEAQKSDSSEKVFFSLKDIDLDKTIIATEKDTIILRFWAKGKLIQSQRQFLSTFSGPNTNNYSY